MAIVLPFTEQSEGGNLGAPPNWQTPACLTYIGYNNLLRAAGAMLSQSTGDARLAADWRPWTFWESQNTGERLLNLSLPFDADNRVLHSQAFENSSFWTLTGMSAFGAGSVVNVLSPSDTMSAEELHEDASNGLHQVSQNVAVPRNTVLTTSVFAKPGTPSGRDRLRILVEDGASGIVARADFDLTLGAVSNVLGSGVLTAKISPSSNGFKRCALTYNSGVAAAPGNVMPHRFRFLQAANVDSYAGSTLASITLWGAQTNTGSAAKVYQATDGLPLIPPTDGSNRDPVTTPAFYTCDYAAICSYVLNGAQVVLEHFNFETFQYEALVTLLPEELDGSPLMKIAGVPASSHLWRFNVQGVPENRLLRSQAFENASWTKIDTTVTPDNLSAPDGTLTADSLLEGVALTAQVDQNVTVAAGEEVAFSVYVKCLSTAFPWVRLRLVNVSGAAGTLDAWFNIVSGFAGATQQSGAGQVTGASIESAGDGWYRCTLKGVVNLDGISVKCLTASASADASTVRVANATRGQWGAQVEQASGNSPSAYQLTTTSTVLLPAKIGVLALGQWLGIPMQEIGWTPPRLARKSVLNTSVSDAGQFLGKSLIRRACQFEITATFLQIDWAYAAWFEFVKHAEQLPFFYLWDIGEAGDSAFCWVDEEIEPPEFSGAFHVDAALKVSALVGKD